MKTLIAFLALATCALAGPKVEHIGDLNQWTANAVTSTGHTIAHRGDCLLVEPGGDLLLYSPEILKPGLEYSVTIEFFFTSPNNPTAEVQVGFGPWVIEANRWQAASWTGTINSKRVWIYVPRLNPGDRLYIRNAIVVRR